MSGVVKLLILTGLAALVCAIAGILLLYKKQIIWVDTPPYQRVSEAPARTLVVVYSRTGNTLGAAREVTRFFDAAMLQIKAPQYGRHWKGQMLASQHADDEVTTTPIQHDPVDLSRYDLIFLCSPTWWFRPAPPLWSFVENHDFVGVSVALLMTGNSRLKEELADKFRLLVEEKNGKFLDRLFIRRGRFYWQKSPTEVHAEVREALNARQNMWPVTAGANGDGLSSH